MTLTERAFGRTGLRWLVIAIAALSVQAEATAQVKPKQEDFQILDRFRLGNDPVDAAGREVLEKIAKYSVGRLTDPNVQKEGMSPLIQEFGRRMLLLPPQFTFQRLNDNQKKYVDEFGRVMITQLEPLVLTQSKPIVRMNAARMVSEIARNGYDGAAELCLKILQKPDETDAVKLYALRGLRDLFAIEPEKDVQPQRTVFQKSNNLQLTELERNSIQALIAFVQSKPNLPDNAPPDELDAFRYVRCEAIRGLGKVRVQTVKNLLGQVQDRPALTLLRASRSDGMTPPTNTKERVEAIIGFCDLIADKDRDMQLDYAIYHIGQAICELGEYKNANLQDMSIPWKVAGERIQEAIDRWYSGADRLKLSNAALLQTFVSMAQTHVLGPLAAGKEGNSPNVTALREWITGQIKLDANSSLFKSDPTTKLNVK